MAYRVRLGGSPKDSGVVLFDMDDAEEAAVNMAKRLCEETDDDADSVEIYGEEGTGAAWGACPEGDDGAYYSFITVED
jgi:hypothetical protein